MNEKSSRISYFIQFISIQNHFDSKFSYAIIYRNLQWCLWQQKTVRKKYESERSKRDRNTKDNFTLWKKNQPSNRLKLNFIHLYIQNKTKSMMNHTPSSSSSWPWTTNTTTNTFVVRFHFIFVPIDFFCLFIHPSYIHSSDIFNWLF